MVKHREQQKSMRSRLPPTTCSETAPREEDNECRNQPIRDSPNPVPMRPWVRVCGQPLD
jgi:hypothetical protein